MLNTDVRAFFALLLIIFVITGCSESNSSAGSQDYHPTCPQFEVAEVFDQEPDSGGRAIVEFHTDRYDANSRSYVVLYSDLGYTIEQVLEPESVTGHADFGVLDRETMTYAVFHVSEERNAFNAFVRYDVPVDHQYEALFLGEVNDGISSCRSPVSVTLNVKGDIPLGWQHSLSGVVSKEVELLNGMMIEVCQDYLPVDRVGNLFVTSSDPDASSELRYGYAVNATFSEGAQIDIEYGLRSKQVPIEANADIVENSAAVFGRHGFSTWGHNILHQGGDETFLVVPECAMGAKYHMAFNHESEASMIAHQAIVLFRDDVETISVELQEADPLFIVDDSSISWGSNGVELSSVITHFENGMLSVGRDSFAVDWELQSPADQGSIHFPVLPDELSEFRGASDIAFENREITADLETDWSATEGSSYILEFWQQVF